MGRKGRARIERGRDFFKEDNFFFREKQGSFPTTPPTATPPPATSPPATPPPAHLASPPAAVPALAPRTKVKSPVVAPSPLTIF